MAILKSGDYPAIRAVIDVKLTGSDLPDETIGQDVFIGRAEAELLARVPDAASKTDNDLKHVTRALIYLTAALIVPSVVRITSMSASTLSTSYSRATFDPDDRVAELRGRAESEINALETPEDTTPGMPVMFTSVSGVRGK